MKSRRTSRWRAAQRRGPKRRSGPASECAYSFAIAVSRRLRPRMKLILNIDVPELRPAIEFYCAALGVKHTRTLDDDTAELTGASSTFYLLQKPGGTEAVHDPL